MKISDSSTSNFNKAQGRFMGYVEKPVQDLVLVRLYDGSIWLNIAMQRGKFSGRLHVDKKFVNILGPDNR